MKVQIIRYRKGDEEVSTFDTETSIWHMPGGGIGVSYSTSKKVTDLVDQFTEAGALAIKTAIASEVGAAIEVNDNPSTRYFDKAVRVS